MRLDHLHAIVRQDTKECFAKKRSMSVNGNFVLDIFLIRVIFFFFVHTDMNLALMANATIESDPTTANVHRNGEVSTARCC